MASNFLKSKQKII